MKLHFTNDWLLRTIESDPEMDIEAAPSIDSSANASDNNRRVHVQLRIGLGVLVRQLRLRDGLSIAELAMRARVSEDELRQVEHDPNYTARPRLIHQLSDYFSVSLVMLSQLAGATHDIDRPLYNEVVRYAARSDDLETISNDELAALDAFVSMLNARGKA